MWELVKGAQIMQNILSLNKPGCRKGMILQVERTGEKMLVVKPMGRQVAVRRGYDLTPVMDLKTGEKIIDLPEEAQKQKTDPDPKHPFRQYPDKIEKSTRKSRSKVEAVAPIAHEADHISGEIKAVSESTMSFDSIPINPPDMQRGKPASLFGRKVLVSLLKAMALEYLEQEFPKALDEVFGIDAEGAGPFPTN